jgi:hypothetical protein
MYLALECRALAKQKDDARKTLTERAFSRLFDTAMI